MSAHPEPHPLAGQTVTIRHDVKDAREMVVGGASYRVEDWWDRVSGTSWTEASGNPAAMQYAIRTGCAVDPVPIDDEVLYGKIDGFGHLVHVTEIEYGGAS
jgi:hypothetical protein